MKTFLALLTLALGFAAHAAESQRAVQSMALPKYPPLAYQAGIEGTVRLSVVVDATGKVVKATVISGHGLLQAAASENVKTWHFAPVPSGDPSDIAVAFVFKIEGKEIPYVEPGKQRSRISLDLPETIVVSAPPMKLVNYSAESKLLSRKRPVTATSQSE